MELIGFQQSAFVQVAMTDSDTKERLALMKVWPTICLLICLFHFAKACTNHMGKVLGSGGSADETQARATAKKFLRSLLDR